MPAPDPRRNRLRYTALLILALLLRSQGVTVVHTLPLRLLVALPLLSGLLLLFVWRRLSVGQRLDDPYPLAGGRITVSVRVSNLAFVPAVFAGISWSDNRYVFGPRPPDDWISVPPRRDRRLQVARPCLYRGRYEVGAESLSLLDVCGLFRLTRALPPLYAAIRPTLRTLPEAPAGSSRGYEDGEAARLESRRGELFDVAAYQPGQPFANIHWKLSAKTGDWIMGRYYSASAPGCVLLLGTWLSEGLSEERQIRVADALASVALTLGRRYLEGGWQVNFSAGSSETLDLTSPDDVQILASVLAELTFLPTRPNSPEIPTFRERFSDGTPGNDVIPHVYALLSGSGAAGLAPEALVLVTQVVTADLAAHLCELANREREIMVFVMELPVPSTQAALLSSGVSVRYLEAAI